MTITTNNSKGSNGLLINLFFKLSLFYLLLGFVTRFVLLLTAPSESTFRFLEIVKIFSYGLINDLSFFVIAFFFMWICLLTLSDCKYKRPWSYIIWGIWALLFIYTFFFNTIFDEYGSVVPKIAKGLFTYKLVSYSIRLFFPFVRRTWSRICVAVMVFIYVVSILFIATSEYFFWDEFGVRFNFIAVDYLIYTNEVIGNIMESYPIIPLFGAVYVVAGLITFGLLRGSKKLFVTYPSALCKVVYTFIYVIACVVSFYLLDSMHKIKEDGNQFVTELEANGSYKFCIAFVNSELSYPDFYKTMPEAELTAVLNSENKSQGIDNFHQVVDSVPEVHKNIVLITIESLSASFMEHFGNSEGITPHLDKLADESLFFTQLYATGNRTVRGLEAVTLCTPPTPGGSVVKQKNNSNLFTTGKLLKERGYRVQYLYGGDSYFDNMKTFFGGNGYEIIDKKSFAKEEITFSNIWGVCDEDMFDKAIKVFNENAASGEPFFGHIMTTSNHRPFTYPEGKIDIPAHYKCRAGGVKYTDYAIGKFIEEAKKQPWFKNTIFVILADHCASSSGKTSIPLPKYHIPALIYAPGFVAPQKVEKMVSQIDVMPTLFGLLHFSYDSYFYGKDVFNPDYKSRAFIATYQDLGYLEKDVFTILSPIRMVEQFNVIQIDGVLEQGNQVVKEPSFERSAIANYQSICKRYVD